jgi:5'-nucleotidase
MGNGKKGSTNERPLILLTNDDGIASPGLLAAAQAVCDLGELLIVAPATQQTGMGRGTPPIIDGILRTESLRVGCEDVTVYAINGSPAQTVVLGVLGIAPRLPSLVVSGINHGENLGTAVTGSGTVGAALQASEFSIPSIAVSLEVEKSYHYNHAADLHWDAAAHFTRLFAQRLLAAQLPFDVDVLKIDVPAETTRDTPWRLTRQAKQSYYQTLPPAQRFAVGPLIDLDYRIYVDWERLEPDTDIYAFARDRVVSVTPLSHDLTSRVDFSDLERLLGERNRVSEGFDDSN